MSERLITSADNPHFKSLRRMADHGAAARKQRMTLLDGPHLLKACLDAGVTIRQLLLTSDSTRNTEVCELVKRIHNVQTTYLAPALFRDLVDVASPTGIAAVIEIPKPESQSPLTSGDVLALDSVQDAGNVGTMLRTAAAAGVQHAVLGRGTARAWSPKVLRAGQGAHFKLAIVEDVDLARWLDTVRLPVLAAEPRSRLSLFHADLSKACVWVFGNEGKGLSRNVRDAVTTSVAIPMAEGTESLNVAAAAAICLFEAVRQRLECSLE